VEYPHSNAEVGVKVLPLREQMIGDVRPALLVLLGAVGLVLLIACTNVANLLLVRGTARQKEFSIRSALGAVRGRLIRQMLTESLTVAMLGGIGGVLLATWGLDIIIALSPASIPRLDQIRLDLYVLGYAFGLSLMTALIFGLAPALQFSRPDLQETLKEGGRGSSSGSVRHRLRNVLVVSEVVLALMLLIGAGLLMRSFVRLVQVNPGFSADNALTLEVHTWTTNRTNQQRASFFERTLSSLSELPGVQSAAAVSALPFHDNSIDLRSEFTVEGRPVPLPGEEPTAFVTVATTDYFATLGIPLRSGRFFNRFDRGESSPIVLIGETMARRYFADDDPVGKKITVTLMGQKKVREIVGGVGDVRPSGFDSEPRTELFLPHLQDPYGSMTYVLRTSGDPLASLEPAKRAIWAINKDQPIASTSSLEQLISRSLGEERFNLMLLGCFAVIALVLASVGIYGLISFSTSQRRHEIGLRMALGADAGDILKMVVGEGMLLAAAGVGLGLVGAFGLTRLMTRLLFGVSPTDPITFVLFSGILLGVALLACYLPARRATGLDPMLALRYE
jgi:putative ABC transport system permease protein